jgi:hypothetical protein
VGAVLYDKSTGSLASLDWNELAIVVSSSIVASSCPVVVAIYGGGIEISLA